MPDNDQNAIQTVPSDPLARERERDRLLTLANVQRMRGQGADARAALEQALALGDAAATESAPVHEMIGDLYAADEKWTEAQEAYHLATAADEKRVSADRKYAQAALRVAQLKEERLLAEALLRGEPLPPELVGRAVHEQTALGRRKPAMALLLSTIAPGFGQFYNGEIVKGAICLGVFVVCLVVFNLVPGNEILKEQLMRLIAASPRAPRGVYSPLIPMALFVAGVIWLYALIDAPTAAKKINQKSGGDTVGTGKSAGPTPPMGDRSGWDV